MADEESPEQLDLIRHENRDMIDAVAMHIEDCLGADVLRPRFNNSTGADVDIPDAAKHMLAKHGVLMGDKG